jgi:hypothetical protein
MPRKKVPKLTGSVNDPERVAETVRQLIRGIAPELRVERRWGQPWYVGRDLVFVVGAFAHHVGVEFWRGTSLKDPHHLLEGTGKNLRHIKLRTLEQATGPEFLELLREAIQLDQQEEPRPGGADSRRPDQTN